MGPGTGDTADFKPPAQGFAGGTSPLEPAGDFCPAAEWGAVAANTS